MKNISRATSRRIGVIGVSVVTLMLAGAIAGTNALATSAAGAASPANTGKLFGGNGRYVEAKAKHPNQGRVRREEVAKGQKPFAIVVSCSDSRVPPEVIFDQGLGDLFVVRTAGHVVDKVAMGSIEYAVAKLGARSVVVLGHERCGAVQAALERTQVPGSIGSIVDAIAPGIASVSGTDAAAMDQAVALNVSAVVGQLRSASPVLMPFVTDGSLEISGAVYDLDSGKVTRMEGRRAK